MSSEMILAQEIDDLRRRIQKLEALEMPAFPKDDSTGALLTIEYPHHEIHDGGGSYAVAGTVDLANGGTINLVVVTPNTTRWAHFTGAVSTESEAAITFHEGITTSYDGAAITAYDRNRNVAGTATVAVYSGGTITGAGTTLYTAQTGSGKQVGGGVREDNEWILKQNTKYLLRVVNATALANWVSYALNWYEHTDAA